MKRLLAIVVLMLVITCLAFGQQQTAPPPKPGPEVSRLGSMVGTWKTDTGETVTYEWFDGGFSLIGHEEARSAETLGCFHWTRRSAGNQRNAVSASLRSRQRPLLQSSKFQRVMGRGPSPLRRKA